MKKNLIDYDVPEDKKRQAQTAINEILREMERDGMLLGFDNDTETFFVVDSRLTHGAYYNDENAKEMGEEYVERNEIKISTPNLVGVNASYGYGPVLKKAPSMKESRSIRGRMLKEEDERVSLDVSYSDKWSEDGKNYMELDIKKNGWNTPVEVCVVFTDKGEHLDTVFYSIYNASEDLTENEVAEKLDVSVGDIKKLVEKAKIEAMKKFE